MVAKALAGEVAAAAAFLMAWTTPLLYPRLAGTLLVGLLFETLTSGSVALVAGYQAARGGSASIRRISIAFLAASAAGSIVTLSVGLHYGPLSSAVILILFFARFYGLSRSGGPSGAQRWAMLSAFGFAGLIVLVLAAVIAPLPVPRLGCTARVLPLLGLGSGVGAIQVHPERFLAVGLIYHLYLAGLRVSLWSREV